MKVTVMILQFPHFLTIMVHSIMLYPVHSCTLSSHQHLSTSCFFLPLFLLLWSLVYCHVFLYGQIVCFLHSFLLSEKLLLHSKCFNICAFVLLITHIYDLISCRSTFLLIKILSNSLQLFWL